MPEYNPNLLAQTVQLCSLEQISQFGEQAERKCHYQEGQKRVIEGILKEPYII